MLGGGGGRSKDEGYLINLSIPTCLAFACQIYENQMFESEVS